MVMSRIWAFLLLVSILCALVSGSGAALAASVLQGAQAGLELAFSMAGAVCLWMGVSALMEKLGLKSNEGFRRNYLHPAIELSLVRMTIPEKPNNRNQRYIKV